MRMYSNNLSKPGRYADVSVLKLFLCIVGERCFQSLAVCVPLVGILGGKNTTTRAQGRLDAGTGDIAVAQFAP